MKNLSFALAIVFILSAAICSNAQTADNTQALAARLVQSASVKPGDVVVIDGGKHMIPLMEAVAVEVQKLGGMPTIMLYSDRVTRSLYTEVPEKYLEQEHRFWGEWMKQANIYITLPASEDNFSSLQGVFESQMTKIT